MLVAGQAVGHGQQALDLGAELRLHRVQQALQVLARGRLDQEVVDRPLTEPGLHGLLGRGALDQADDDAMRRHRKRLGRGLRGKALGNVRQGDVGG